MEDYDNAESYVAPEAWYPRPIITSEADIEEMRDAECGGCWPPDGTLKQARNLNSIQLWKLRLIRRWQLPVFETLVDGPHSGRLCSSAPDLPSDLPPSFPRASSLPLNQAANVLVIAI